MIPRNSARRARTLAFLAPIAFTFAQAAAQSPGLPPRDVHQAMTTKPEAPPSTLVVNDPATPQTTQPTTPPATAAEPLSADALQFREHVTTLANPFFEGRVPGSRGNRLAADYIQWAFEKAGLQPAFDAPVIGETNGPRTFRQSFRAGSDTTVTRQDFVWTAAQQTTALTPGTDFTVLGLSGTGEVNAPIVFVGYGIDQGPDGYRGFADDTDLTGAIAMVFRFEPMDDQGRSLWTKGNGWSPASSLDGKIEALIARKAAGIILVNPPGAADPRASRLITPRDSLPFRTPAAVPVVMLDAARADAMLAASGTPGLTLAALRAKADAPEPVLMPLGASLAAGLNVAIARNPIMTDNVGAILPGKGALAGEWVIIGAHHDHLGWGPVGARPENFGQLHPGADDNASGTSGVLMLASRLARTYAQLPTDASARSILFLTFCAEESGLNGSRFYANNPPAHIPNDRVTLMINMDMIGRVRNNTIEVQGTATADGMLDVLQPLFDASGLTVRHGSTVASNSDHASFFAKNIPVLFFFSGLHREYHTPQDTSDTINFAGGARVIDLVNAVALAAAQRPERFTFNAATRAAQAASPGPMRTRVRFGIAPGTYSDDKPGIEIGDVYEGTPAADAGLKVGDRMIKWNGKELRRVEDWMPMLTQASPGDVVDVTILRNGQEQTIKVTLKARDAAGR